MACPSILSLLTEDILVRILDKLGDERDRKNWRMVCKEFHRVELLHRKKLRVLRHEFLQRLLSKYSSIEFLDLSVCPRIDDGSVAVLLGGESLCWPRRLKSLVLNRVAGLRTNGLELLVSASPNLEYVDVSYCWGFGDREAEALARAGGLRELRMDKCLAVTDVGLAKIAVGCENLENLSLKWCMEISDLGIDLLCKKCLGLKSLDISYLKVTNKSLYSIASLQKLVNLAMVWCSSIDDVGLNFIGNGCPSLKVIDVSRCDLVGSSGLLSVIKGHSGLSQLSMGNCLSELSESLLHSLKDMKNMNSFEVDGARVSDSFFQILSINGKHLLEIGLSKCLGVTDGGISQLLDGCVNLKILNLTCCHSISDAAILAVANSCKTLHSLKLESCNLITEKGLRQLGLCCLQLEELDLTDCGGVSDTGLRSLSRCSELICLKLGLCTNISDEGLFYIASNCTKILELDLYRCTRIGNCGLAALSIGCKKLMKLNLSYCNKVTDKGMEHLSHLEELSKLEMRGLLKVTNIGLTAVASRCKKLSDLDLKHCEHINDSGFWALAYYSRNLRQINMSHCSVSNVGLCMVMGNLTRLQDAKLVELTNVTVEGFELALRACCVRLKKVKLHTSLRHSLSAEVIFTLQARGCKIRWD